MFVFYFDILEVTFMMINICGVHHLRIVGPILDLLQYCTESWCPDIACSLSWFNLQMM
jgi:hypothetical protein